MPNKISYSKKLIYKKDDNNRTILENGAPVLDKIVVTASKRGNLGMIVTATATCVEVDKFDYEKGKELARLRLEQQFAELRISNDRENIMYHTRVISENTSRLNKYVKKLVKHRKNLEEAKNAETELLNYFNK